MNEQELMKFVIERSNDPIIKNPVLRDAMNKDLGPRNMYVAGGVIKAAKKLLSKTPEPKPTKKIWGLPLTEKSKPSILRREAVPLNLTQVNEISKNKEFEQAWKNYKISIRKVGRRKFNKDQFFEIWARENMAQGGRIGFAENPLKNFDRKTRKLDVGVAKMGSERVSSKIMKHIYKDKATGKEIEVFKVKITDQPSNKGGNMKAGKGGNYKTLLSKEFSTLEEAIGSRDDYYKDNPGKRVVDPTKKSDAKKKRRENEKLAGGDERFKQGNKKIQKGHSTNIEGKNKIKPKNIIYTPTEINSKMGGKAGAVDTQNPSSLDSLDLKQRNTEAKIEEIKKSKLPESEKKRLLDIEDKKLTKYVAQSDGFKTSVLSDGSEFGTSFRSLQSQDMFDEFPDMTEKQVKEFVGEYFTQKGDLKPKYANAKNLPQSVKDNIVKAYTFNENVKNAQANAKKSKLNPKQEKMIKNLFCGNKKGGQPGTCDISEALDNMVRETNAVKNGKIKGAAANNVLKKAGKVGRFGTGTGLGAVLGPWGIAGEAAFEIAMAVPGYGKGKSGKRILGDSLLGLIPGVGQSSEEEFTEYATKDGMQDFEQQQIKDANRFLELSNSLGRLQNAGALEGKGSGRGNVGRAENLFFKQMDEYTPLYNQFVGAPPSESVSTVISNQDRINRQIAEAEAIRAQKRNIAGEEDFMAAEGGLANLMKKYYD